ncbi:NADPH:quinone oxidoreductase family protein [Nocardia beijingensis]|uniref:NADPH:quinone oxidoreductase family protein n=1 Tax=Nocardia beijingensis TaxID=95162 RepID=UPI0034118865
MYAQQLTEISGPDGVQLIEMDEPEGSDLVVVDMHAAGVAFPDLLQTTGSYQVTRPIPFVLGLEGAGIVRSTPSGTDLRPGQRVAMLAPSGTWQQTVAVHPDSVFPLPDSVSLNAGAGFLVNYFTAHFALDERARCRPGDTVLIHGAAGGVGVAALQTAAALGLRTIAVVSTPEKAEVARANRADDVVFVDGWRDHVRILTDGRGVDIILDPVGGERFTDSLRSLAPNGRLVVLGFTGGEIPTVKVNRLLLGNTSLLGAAWGEYAHTNPGYAIRQWRALSPLLESGALQVTEPTMYTFECAADALWALENRTASGKIALSLHRE